MQTDNTLLRAQSPAALAEEYIVRSIWDDVFPAGTNLPSERDLADKIGVTRTTLREVLQRLARDGWLTIQHGKPTKVNDIWDTAGPSIIETLITLDRQSAPLIIENMLSLRSRMSESYIYEAVKNSPKASAVLFKGMDALENTAESYMEFDYALFRQFTVMANKPFYRLIFNSLRGVYHKIGLLFFSEEKHRQVTHDFYVELRDICESGQSDLVVECIRKHKQVTSAYWRAILESLPKDLEFFYENYEYAILNIDTSCEIRISSLSELQPTNQILYPADDVIWEELADDISNDWFMIASSQELSQYISIDLNKKRFGFCYDSFIETHATPDESPIIAKSFTELLEKLVSNEKEWFWLDSSFQSYGDAYEDE